MDLGIWRLAGVKIGGDVTNPCPKKITSAMRSANVSFLFLKFEISEIPRENEDYVDGVLKISRRESNKSCEVRKVIIVLVCYHNGY